jgi:AraC-like DNA-binding protein
VAHRDPPSGYRPADLLAAGYRELRPPPALRGAVACLWIRVTPADDAAPLRVLPDGCSDLFWQSGFGGQIAGPDTHSVMTRGIAGTTLVGVRFRPGAAGAALGLPLSELRNLRVATVDVLPTLDEALRGELRPDEALSGLTRIAADLIALAPPDRLVRQAARLLETPGRRIPEVAEALGVSERQLLRRCRAAVGYGPKTLQRVLRLRRFLALRAAEPGRSLADVAAVAGYADQAHLARDCERLTGLLPSARELAGTRRRR